MKNNTKQMVGIGLLTAIVVVLQMIGGGIRFGMFSITLVLIPIVVGAAVYNWIAGAWLGLAFGITVLLTGDAAAFLAVDVAGTIFVVLAKGVLCGLGAGAVYALFKRWNENAAVILAAVVCPIINTGVFLLGCVVFFMDTIQSWAAAEGYSNVAGYMFLALAGINFLVEVVTNMVLAPVIIRIIRIGKRK